MEDFSAAAEALRALNTARDAVADLEAAAHRRNGAFAEANATPCANNTSRCRKN